MKKLLLILLCLPMIGFGQVNEGYHEFFQKACERAFSTEKGLKMNHLKESNSDAFCVCWTEKIFTHYTKTELEKMYNDAISSNANYYEASYIVFNYPKVKEIIIDCMQNESFKDDSYIDLNPEKLSVFVKQCKDDLRKEFTTNQEYSEFKLLVDINNYCECYMKNIINEFTINEMANFEKNLVNKAKRDKIQESCFINNFKQETELDTTRYYYENGQLKSESSRKGGQLHGISKIYFENGQLEKEKNYKDGKQDGLWKVYFENGQLEKEVTWKDGIFDGIFKTNYENGQLRSKGNYKNDRLDGLWQGYYDNGQLYQKGNYKDGKQDGLWKVYYGNSQLLSEGNYKDGKQDGLWKSYYENGQLAEEVNHKNGELISFKCWDKKGNELDCEDVMAQ